MKQTLYRKLRPCTFDGVVGQNHITGTLKNQIASGRIGHAYLFCGSRGVGKTSLARIFASAVNCQSPSCAPCGKCGFCSIPQPENLDIIEIDAASNNGVDDARDLREKVKYPPLHGKYKVYIIDEAHMLTGSAFNALLKTLEEPPAHAVFILATTEPHKLPATILSRCMRFDFRLVGMDDLCCLISGAMRSENKQFEDEAIRAIAAAAEGSCRDALSLADTCLGFSSGVLTAAEVSQILGGGSTATESLFLAIVTGDVATALTAVDELHENGKSMNVLSRELARFARDLLVAKSCPGILKCTNERLSFLIVTAEQRSAAELAALVTTFAEAENFLRYSSSPRVAFESLILRACHLVGLDLAAFDQRILRTEQQLDKILISINSAKNGSFAGSPPSASSSGTSENLAKAGKKSADTSAQNGLDSASANSEVPQEFVSFSDANYSSGSVEPSNQTTASPAKPAQKLSAVQLWGRVITYFRRNSSPALTQVVGRHNPARLALDADNFTIFASREDYLLMCDATVADTLRDALTAAGLTRRIVIEKDAADIDLEREITALESEFGKSKVNIVK